MKSQNAEAYVLLIQNKEQQSLRFFTLKAFGKWIELYGLKNHSEYRKSDEVLPPEPFSCYATKAKVNTLLERLMECSGALHLETCMG